MTVPKDGRLIVPDYNPHEALRPAKIAGSTYVRPAYIEPDNTFASLAAALGNFASFASRAGHSGDAEKKDSDKKLWAADFALKPPKDRQAMIDNGEVPKDYKDVAGVIHGSSRANDFNRSLPGMMEAYDPSVDGSKSAFVERKFQEAVADLSPEEKLGFDASTRESRTAIQDSFQKELDAEAQLKLQNDHIGYLRNGVDAMNTKGAPASEVIKKVMVDSDLDPKLTGLLPSQKNGVLFELAKEWAATGRPDLVKALVDYNRPGVGKLSDTIEWRDKFDALVGQANTEFNDRNLLQKTPELQGYNDAASRGAFGLEEMNGAFTKNPSFGAPYFHKLYVASEEVKAKLAMDAERNAGNTAARLAIDKADFELALDGNFDIANPNKQIIVKHNKDGSTTDEEVTYAQRKDAVLYNIGRFADGLRKQGWSDEQVRAKEMTLYSQNNLTNPAWSNQMDAVAISGSMSAATKGDTSDSQVTGELYRNLVEVNPTMAKNHVGANPANEMWLETYRLARESGKTGTDSTILAAKAVEDLQNGVKYKINAYEGNPPIERGMGALKKAIKSTDTTWFGNNESSAVGVRAAAEVVKRAEFYMGTMKMSEAQALERAAEWMKNTHVVIGNELVFAGYEGQPRDFKQRVDRMLVDKYGEDDAPNYSLMEIDGGRTYLITDPNGIPVLEEQRDDRAPLGPPKLSIFTVPELIAHGKAMEDAALNEQIDLVNKAKADRALLEDTQPETTFENPAIKASNGDRDLMIRTVLGEAVGEDEVGQAAVAHVIVNRSRDARWDETVGDVATQQDTKGYYQFSAWNSEGKEGNAAVMMDAKDPRYLAAAAVIDKVLSGETPDPTGGAVYYVAPGSLKAPPDWWEKAKQERGGNVITIGNHTFTGKAVPRKKKVDGQSDAGDIKSRGLIKYSRADTATHPLNLASLKPEMKTAMGALAKAWPEEITLNSGYRDPKTNKAVGGADKSQHTGGKAVDVSVAGWPLEKRKDFIKLASSLGFTGIGVYNNAIHIDLGSRRAWGPSRHVGSVPKWARGVIAAHLYKQVAAL